MKKIRYETHFSIIYGFILRKVSIFYKIKSIALNAIQYKTSHNTFGNTRNIPDTFNR